MHQVVACLDQQSVPGILPQFPQNHLLLHFRWRSNLASQNKKKQATHQINKPFQNSPHKNVIKSQSVKIYFKKLLQVGLLI
jgi:hypothetical protein